MGWLISSAADYAIEYNWWKEVGQVDTWLGMLWYSVTPAATGAVVAFAALWMAHGRGLHFAGGPHAGTAHLLHPDAPVGAGYSGRLVSRRSIDDWTVMRYLGALRIAGARREPGRIPSSATRCHFICSICRFTRKCSGSRSGSGVPCVLVFWATARGWQLADRSATADQWRRQTADALNLRLPTRCCCPGATRAGLRALLAGIAPAADCGGLDFSGQLRPTAQLARVHDRSRLRRPKSGVCPSALLLIILALCGHSSGWHGKYL